MGHLGAVFWQGLIVIGPSGIWVEAQVELIFPAELKASVAQCFVPKACTRVSFCDIARMGSELVRDEPCLHIVFVRKSEVLFGRHVTEHGAAKPTNHCSTNAAGDVVVARSDVCGERPECVKRCFVAMLEL